MAGVRVTITLNGVNETTRALKEIETHLSDTQPLMREIAEVAKTSVETNFEVGGRPVWKPLAASTIQAKGHSKPLLASNVLRNIVTKVTDTSVTIGVQPAAKDYAAIQHLGGKAGRGQKVTIPARPFMLLQSEDIDEIERLVDEWVSKPLKS